MRTAFQELRALMLALGDFTSRINRAEASRMIQDACLDAFAKLGDEERVLVLGVCESIQVHVDRLGDKGALELLAAIGDVMDVEV
jgi:hypothetical protein